MISKRGLLELGTEHPETLNTLEDFYTISHKATWHGLMDVRKTFADADQVGNVLIFNILGNKYRLICTVTYTRQTMFVKALLTHTEYDRKGWMKWA